MNNKLIPIVLTLVVGIILAGSVLMPVLGDAQNKTSDTIVNETSGLTFKLDGNDDYLFESAPAYANYKVNGQNAGTSSSLGTFIITDKCRVYDNGHYFQLYDESGTRSSNINVQNKNIVITYDAADKTFTYTVYTDLTNATVENTYTYTVENILYYIPGGDYGAINTSEDSDITYYVNDLSQVIAGGAYTSGDLDTSYFAEGKTVYVGDTDYTASADAVTSKYNGYTDAIVGSGYTVTVTDGTNSETFTPYTVFVPLKITAHTSEQNGMIALYGAIPIMVIVALLMVAVGAVARRND